MNYYYTIRGGHQTRIIGQRSTAGTHYIRTHPDDTAKDNLLSLLRF